MLISMDLVFTGGEGCDITAAPHMLRRTVTERLRSRLRQLLREDGRGAAAALVRFSHNRGRKSPLSPQELSYFVNEAPGRRGITLDDLDDLADYFRVSLSDLLGAPKGTDLAADEQRLVLAFRVLPLPIREHFLAILEASSVSVQLSADRLQRQRQKSVTTASPKGLDGAGGAVHAATLESIRGDASALAQRLAAFATGATESAAVRAVDQDEP